MTLLIYKVFTPAHTLQHFPPFQQTREAESAIATMQVPHHHIRPNRYREEQEPAWFEQVSGGLHCMDVSAGVDGVTIATQSIVVKAGEGNGDVKEMLVFLHILHQDCGYVGVVVGQAIVLNKDNAEKTVDHVHK